MGKELVISSNRHEVKVAVMEDDQLVEVFFQRSNEYSLAGSIHKGRVTRVLPGMQSAFIDIGCERAAFLHVADIWEARNHEGIRPIERMLSEGQGLLVQVKMEANILAECGRCLIEFPQRLETNFTELYAFSANSMTESGLILPENGKINLTPILRD